MNFTLSTYVHEQIQAAGIPIQGVSYNSKEEPFIRVDFKEEATDEQRKQAQEIVDDCLKNQEKYQEEWEAAQAPIEKYGSEKNAAMAQFLLDKGIATQAELDTYFV